MEVEFKDKRLALIESERFAETKLPLSVINSCRNKLPLLRMATDERTLRNWKSLHYEKLDGDREGQRSIRLNDKWRVIFILSTESMPAKITILEINNHYE